MFKKILIILVLLIACFGVVVAMQPDEFEIERTASVDASASEVFDQINNLRKWHEWSPWAKMDPNAKKSFEGPVEGEDAMMHWSGNMEVGVGSMKIVKSNPGEFVQLDMEFLEPLPGKSKVEFKLVPDGSKTNVSWSMSGKHNYVQKAMCLVFNGKKMVGEQFDQGLMNLNTVVNKN